MSDLVPIYERRDTDPARPAHQPESPIEKINSLSRTEKGLLIGLGIAMMVAGVVGIACLFCIGPALITTGIGIIGLSLAATGFITLIGLGTVPITLGATPRELWDR